MNFFGADDAKEPLNTLALWGAYKLHGPHTCGQPGPEVANNFAKNFI